MQVGIAGYGVVGKALARFFSRPQAHAVRVYDKYLQPFDSPENLRSLDRCDIVFIAVPTPYDAVASCCDLSAVNEIVDALTAPLCIKSTVPPGTVDSLIKTTGKRIAFSPEYVGESPAHPWREIGDCGFVVVGGDAEACVRTLDAHRAVAPDLQLVQTAAAAAELVKYMENAFLATKVAFVNQFYDLARDAGVGFDEVRKLFLLDSRVGESHTVVSAERGFGGKCLPKDLHSIVAWAGQGASAPLLQAVLEYNESVRFVASHS
jgi:UDPglucose 6-dehydrogenase